MTAPTAPAPADLLDRAYDVSPRVAVRPESFGALLYHFGTRRLSFLKDRRLLAAVQALPASRDRARGLRGSRHRRRRAARRTPAPSHSSPPPT